MVTAVLAPLSSFRSAATLRKRCVCNGLLKQGVRMMMIIVVGTKNSNYSYHHFRKMYSCWAFRKIVIAANSDNYNCELF